MDINKVTLECLVKPSVYKNIQRNKIMNLIIKWIRRQRSMIWNFIKTASLI